jgi:hypothetical protein
MSGVTLDWSSAEVRDGKLEVGLGGELPRGWKHSFQRTVALLGRGRWGEVTLKKDRVRVHQVEEGSEDRLRHFLESVVLQANAEHEPPEADADEDPDADEDADEGPDAEMTKRFRSFAGEADD